MDAAQDVGDIGALAIACDGLFNKLANSLPRSSDDFRRQMPIKAIDNELARFKIWAGNLGALQRGRSSLDARTRDSMVLRAAVLKFLEQLRGSLSQSMEVVDGHRLPYEQQLALDPRQEDQDSLDRDEDIESIGHVSGSSSETETEELVERLSEIRDIMEHLYRLSFKIRNAKYRSLTKKALLWKEEDPESGKDLFSAYAVFDRRHVQESLKHLRTPQLPMSFADESARSSDHNDVDVLDPENYQMDSNDYLEERLARAITNRRRYFAYWQTHALKLSGSAKDPVVQQTIPDPTARAGPRGQASKPRTTALVSESILRVTKTETQTVAPETEVSIYNREVDDLLETETAISYATTARDISGKSAELPTPPANVVGKSEFLCPYCWIVCPSREGKGKLWQEHIRHDLQPYVCTYEDCPDADLMYTSRHAWLEHERLVHRRIWRCFEHRNFISKAKDDLLGHFKDSHEDLNKEEIESFLSLAEVTEADDRHQCPFCHSLGPFDKGLQNHIAFHQEQLSTFAAPRNLDNIEEVESGRAQGVRSNNSLSLNSSLSSESISDLESNSAGQSLIAADIRLLRAVKSGNLEEAELLLRSCKANPNRMDSDGETSLYYAARIGYEELVISLVDYGADINTRSGYYGNAFQVASHEGYMDIVAILLDRGADINAQGGHYGNALQAAVAGNYLGSQQDLLRSDGKFRLRGSGYGNTVLSAILDPNDNMIKYLLDRGADMNAQGGFYGNALQAASTGRYTEMVRILIDRGADVNAQGGYYGNALQAAIVEGYKGIVSLLIDAGADVNAKGGPYGYALQAASAGGYAEIVQILLNKGAYVNVVGGQFGTALQAAQTNGHTAIATILLRKGAIHNPRPSPIRSRRLETPHDSENEG